MGTYKTAPANQVPAQRVELHLHTQYSAMDGLCDVAQAVHLAAAMGHTALAITDHAVVQAFPEAALACREVQREHPGFKVIYGCEVFFVPNSDGPFTKNKTAGGKACCTMKLSARFRPKQQTRTKMTSRTFATM